MDNKIRELLLGSKRLNKLKKPQKSTNVREGAPNVYRKKPTEVK
jgi:hypothetical protein